MQKELLACITPLSKGGSKPAPRDLSEWWSTVERVVCSLGPEIRLQRLDEMHIVHVGPVILGQGVWRALESSPPESWEELKDRVNKRYGMDEDQVLDAFYAMQPVPDESAEHFVDRVEERRLAIGEGTKNLYRHFTKALSKKDRLRLDGMAETAAWMGGSKLARADWTSLVQWAHH